MTEWERYKIHKNAFWKCEKDVWQIINLIIIEQNSTKEIYYKTDVEKGKYQLIPIMEE